MAQQVYVVLSSAERERTLILATRGRDALVARGILREAGLAADICGDVADLVRELRRLKDGIEPIPLAASEGFRNQIKRVELEAERIEQRTLESLAETLKSVLAPSPQAAAQASLAAYQAHLGSLPGDALKIVLDAFTKTPP